MLLTEHNRMTWDEIVEKYPDLWVSVRDAEMNGPDIVSGIIEETISDEAVGDYKADHWGDDLVIRRTTEGEWLGPISADFIIEVK